jgi:hypothetical protein
VPLILDTKIWVKRNGNGFDFFSYDFIFKERSAQLMKSFNDWLGNKLALYLSTMGCFYIIFMLVIVPLFFQHPNDLVGWVQYIVQSIFQGVALPIFGFDMKVGENQVRVLNETNDTVMQELALVKKELQLAREASATLQELIEELHQHNVVTNNVTLR